jgi:AP-1 complex subunit mu
MASVVAILDGKGAPLISRSFRGDTTDLNISQTFVRRVLEADESVVRPVFDHNGYTIIWVRHNNIFAVCASRVNCNPALCINMLRRCMDVFQSYFDNVTEESVRDNFVIIYELLDEMIDFGYPQYTEAKILKEYVTQEGFKLPLPMFEEQLQVKNLPSAVTGVNGACSWRPPGIKHRKNEVFLDVIETVNLLVSAEGETLQSDIVGCLKMKVQLSGMPDVKLGLNDRLLLSSVGSGSSGKAKKTVDLEDIKFHQCVKLNRFESDRTITFVPPDGSFDLMTYRLNQKVRPLIHVEVTTQRHGTSRVEMLVKARSTYKKSSTANSVEIFVPVPCDADTPSAKANFGTVKYQPEQECLVWSMKQFPGSKEYMCKCTYTLPSVRASDPTALSKKPVSVKFEVPYFTVSGFQVRYLKVTEKSGYEAFPWVRYVTQSGDYQVRTT